jgi:hypothetical protein
VICIQADTTKFHKSLEDARTRIQAWDRLLQAKVIEDDMRTVALPAGYEMHRLPPDWESRLWQLTHDLAVRMADRCQEGLMHPEEFGKLAHAMADWTVNAAIEAAKPKPLSAEEIARLLKPFSQEGAK